MLTVNAVLGLVILILIELRLCSACRKFTFATVPEPKSDKELKLDDDVLEEERRVQKMVMQTSS